MTKSDTFHCKIVIFIEKLDGDSNRAGLAMIAVHAFPNGFCRAE